MRWTDDPLEIDWEEEEYPQGDYREEYIPEPPVRNVTNMEQFRGQPNTVFIDERENKIREYGPESEILSEEQSPKRSEQRIPTRPKDDEIDLFSKRSEFRKMWVPQAQQEAEEKGARAAEEYITTQWGKITSLPNSSRALSWGDEKIRIKQQAEAIKQKEIQKHMDARAKVMDTLFNEKYKSELDFDKQKKLEGIKEANRPKTETDVLEAAAKGDPLAIKMLEIKEGGKADNDIRKFISLNPAFKDKVGTPEFKRGYEEHVRTMAGAKSAISEEAKEEIAQSLAKGELTRLRDVVSLRASAGGAAIEIFNRARQINPNFSTAEIDRKIKTEEAFTVGKDGQNIQSFGTFLEHAGAADAAVMAINNTNPPLVNKPINWWKQKMKGDPEFQAFMVSLEPVRKEFEGFLLGGRALYGDDREQAKIILSDDSSLAQVKAALKQMGHTAKARFNEMNHRYKRVMGKDIPDPFGEEAINGASRIGVDLLGKGKPNIGGNAPPAHLLKEGFATPFGSKGTWTLIKGVPTRVD